MDKRNKTQAEVKNCKISVMISKNRTHSSHDSDIATAYAGSLGLSSRAGLLRGLQPVQRRRPHAAVRMQPGRGFARPRSRPRPHARGQAAAAPALQRLAWINPTPALRQQRSLATHRHTHSARSSRALALPPRRSHFALRLTQGRKWGREGVRRGRIGEAGAREADEAQRTKLKLTRVRERSAHGLSAVGARAG